MICGDPLNDPNSRWYDDNSHWNTASQFYTMLTSWGFNEQNIITHYAEGWGPDGKRSMNSPYHLSDNDIDYVASLLLIGNTFNVLQQLLTPQDVLVVFVNGHGGTDNNYGSWHDLPNGEVLTDTALTALTANINCASMFFSINVCYAGGFIDDLINVENSLCKNRVIHTPSSHDQPNASEEWITGHFRNQEWTCDIQEFPLYWSAAAHGIYPRFIDMNSYFLPSPWEYQDYSYNVGTFPFESYSYYSWNNAFYPLPATDPHQHLNNPDRNPDEPGIGGVQGGNNDGILQLFELFDYANDFDTRSEYGYVNPFRGGTPILHRIVPTPMEEYNPLQIKNYMTLRGLAGNVSDPDLHFSTDFVVGDHLRLLAGSELTIEDSVHVKILDGASIIVQRGATLNIGENCVIYFDSTDPAIIVSGAINIAESVQFMNGSQTSSSGLFLDRSDSVSMSNVSFENCSIRSENSGLSVVNSIFINSSISQRSKCLNVSGCSFTNSSINAYQTGTPPLTDQVSIYESTFSDYNGCAIKITGYPKYIIEHDTLRNVGSSFESAIMISESGSGGLYSIIDNSISDCTNAGVKLYHSFAKIASENHISNSDNGIVAFRESSWAAEGNQGSPYQILSENETYELFFSYDSAPENLSTMIIDHGTYNSPYVMCINVPPVHTIVDLSYNCWEGNFIPINDLQPSGLYIYLPYWTPGNKSAVEDSLCKAILGEAIDNIEDGYLNIAKNLLESLVSTYPDNQYATSALKRLYQIAIMMESDLGVLKTYYQDSSISENSNLSNVAEYLAIQCDIGLGNYTQAIMWFEDIIMSPPTVIDSLFAQIDLGYLYMSMPDSTKYQCRYPGYRPTSWAAFEQTKSALLAMITGNSYENTDNSNIPAPSVSNFPNPFNPSTTIRFSIPQDSSVKLVVYNIRGQVVKTIVNDTLPKGSHSAFWNGVDENGRAVSSGVYFYRLQTGNTFLTGKCLLLK